jgi:hypothetical protein
MSKPMSVPAPGADFGRMSVPHDSLDAARIAEKQASPARQK